MRFVRRIAIGMFLGIPIAAIAAQSGAPYPTRTVRIVIPFPPAGSPDVIARLIAPKLSEALGQSFIVDNRGGGGGIRAGELAAKAPPDGYTLLCYGPPIWMSSLLRSHVPFDPLKDFAPINMATITPNVLVVHPSVPVQSVSDLIALAKARPGQLNDAGSDLGSSAHLAMELFKSMAGLNIVRVPYKGVGPGVNALIAGEVQMMIPVIPAAMPHVKSGRLKALAVTTAKPSPLVPGLPTMAASGVPGYESTGWGPVFAPAGTPRSIINRLNQEIQKLLALPEARSRFFSIGAEPLGTTPEEMGAIVRSEMAKWGKLIKERGIHED